MVGLELEAEGGGGGRVLTPSQMLCNVSEKIICKLTLPVTSSQAVLYSLVIRCMHPYLHRKEICTYKREAINFQ